MVDTKTSPHLEVRVRFLSNACTPENFGYATDVSAGLDLRACMAEQEIVLDPGERYLFPAGIAIEITRPGIAGFVFSRSGLGAKHGLTVSQGVGVIDPDYRGEIKVSLLNTSQKQHRVLRGQRIAQLVFLPFFHTSILPVSELGRTARGDGGFGHTGEM
nr:dUTP diphosphatase [Desulfoplanes formicivorans]